MKLIFLGSGSAFYVGGNYQSNMLLEGASGQRLLIDCGSDIRFSLHEFNLDYNDISGVYISHLHPDHAGGLSWLGFTRRFNSNAGKPNLYIQKDMAQTLWENVLKGAMSTLQIEKATLRSFFNVHKLETNSSFDWEKITFHLVQVVHAMDGFSIIPSYGLFFEYRGKKIFITTDTQFSPHQLVDFYEVADLIFHDCETSSEKSGVHAHYEELRTLDRAFKQKMWLYHYNMGTLPDAKGDHFRGFVKRGQLFDLNDIATF